MLDGLNQYSTLRIGCDLIEISRIAHLLQKYSQRFLQKILTPAELACCLSLHTIKLPSYISKRFAAKEAFAKALGTGFGRELSFHDLQIFNYPSGQPYIQISPVLQSQYRIHSISLTLSDERAYGMAFCILQ